MSALLDGCTQEVVSYEVSRHPNLAQTISMMEKAVKRYPSAAKLTFHIDQGWRNIKIVTSNSGCRAMV
ncbi:hypothetical protein [Fructobacillus cardui]|uniref:hypothetical protein n=1 Tax=Fructobacillus cardui TaxID=2893170 RepID=UPI0030C8590C